MQGHHEPWTIERPPDRGPWTEKKWMKQPVKYFIEGIGEVIWRE
jgi:hypothetical protein